MNKVVTVVTPMGEVVGRVKEYSGESIVLENPRLFVQTQQGAGFAQGVSMTGEIDPKEVAFYFSNILCIVDTSSDAEKAWIQATSGIVLS